VAKKIITANPDIALIDQGMYPIEGHKVILEARELSDNLPLFVGNTGGSGDEFEEIGIFDNFSKGEKPQVMRQILSRI